MSTEQRITDPATGAQKGQKIERFDLIPFDALEEVARVYGVGARKYSDDNWLGGYRWRLSLGALMRHVARFMVGEDLDPETGCHHLAHAAWHCLTIMTFHMRGLGTDDRRPPVGMRPVAPTMTAPMMPDYELIVDPLEGIKVVSLEDEDLDEPIPFALTTPKLRISDTVEHIADKDRGIVMDLDNPLGDEWVTVHFFGCRNSEPCRISDLVWVADDIDDERATVAP